MAMKFFGGKKSKDNRKGFIPHITPLCAGFTIVELIVVVAITSILSGFIILYGRSSGERVAISTEESKIGQVILRAKSFAISTYADSHISSCGFGLMVNYPVASYSLVSYSKDSGGGCGNISFSNSGRFVTLENYTLAPGLAFATDCSGTACPKKLRVVLFVPPDPQTLVWNEPPQDIPDPNGSGNIYLTTASGKSAFVVKISVSWAGQVTFSSY